MKIIFNWLSFLLIAVGIYFFFKYVPAPGYLTGPEVIVFALSIAFLWVDVLKWGVTKPFTCVKCMCGWFAVILALLFHTPHWYFYLPMGLFVGAMYEGIKMRWL